MKNSLPLAIAIAAILSACATTANYEKILQSWVGSEEIDLIRKWGPPNKVTRLVAVRVWSTRPDKMSICPVRLRAIRPRSSEIPRTQTQLVVRRLTTSEWLASQRSSLRTTKLFSGSGVAMLAKRESNCTA